MSDKDYFATKPAQELASNLYAKVNEYRQALSRNGIQRKWRRSYQLYFGRHFAKTTSFTLNDSEIVRTGDKGELAAFAINHYRNLIKHTLVLTTNEKPAWNTRAINTDPDSIQQAKLGNNILDYYMNDKRLGRYYQVAAEHSQVFGRGHVYIQWDPGMGKAYSTQNATDENGESVLDENGQPEQKIVYEGDLDIRTPSVYDVWVDPGCDDWRHLNYWDVGIRKNRYDLCAQYPAKKEEILAISQDKEIDRIKDFTFMNFEERDHIEVRYFNHKATKAMPNGRLTIYCGNDVVLYDGPYPYEDKCNLLRIVPGEIFGTTEGYTDFFDLMGIQEALDVLVSIAFSNQQANGTQKVWAPDGCNLTVTQISKGLAFLRSAPGTKPEPLQLTQTAKEIFEMIPMLQKSMESVSGINSVARGDPEQLKSGVAVAYVQAMAAQYTSAFQKSWAELLEDGGSLSLWMLKQFADQKRMISITGKKTTGNATYDKNDISKIDRVTIDLANPMTKALGGRLEIADKLADKGLLKTAQDYLSLIESGNLETVTDGAEVDEDLVRKENEFLMDGKPVRALVGDAHLFHMQKHKEVYSDPDLRMRAAMQDPVATAVIKAALDHEQEHMQLYKTQDPLWSQVAGEPPAPQPMPPPPMGPPPGPGPQGPPPGPNGPHHVGPPPQNVHHPLEKKPGPPLSEIMSTQAPVAKIPRLAANLQPGAMQKPIA